MSITTKKRKLSNTVITYTVGDNSEYYIDTKQIAEAMDIDHADIVKEVLVIREELKRDTTEDSVQYNKSMLIESMRITEIESYLLIGRLDKPESLMFINDMMDDFDNMVNIIKNDNIVIEDELKQKLEGFGVDITEMTTDKVPEDNDEKEVIYEDHYDCEKCQFPISYDEFELILDNDTSYLRMQQWAKRFTCRDETLTPGYLLVILVELGFYNKDYTVKTIHMNRGYFFMITKDTTIGTITETVVSKGGADALTYGIQTYLDSHL